MIIMKRKIILITITAQLIISLNNGTSVANSQDHNHNTNREDGNYENNNQNPFDYDTIPSQDTQPRSGQYW